MAEVGRFAHLSANGTTVVSANSCTLLHIIINKIGASSNVLTIYDGVDTTGAVVAVIDTTIAGAPEREYDCILQSGCCAVMGTGTAADVTIVTG